MFELTVEREFCAAHAIVIAGEREPVHGHNWKVHLTVTGEALDGDGLLCDFHALERILDGVLALLDNQDLNAVPPFDRINPTAEHVAHHIATATATSLPSGITVTAVTVTEAPGCRATFRP